MIFTTKKFVTCGSDYPGNEENMITYGEWAKEQRTRELLHSDTLQFMEHAAVHVWLLFCADGITAEEMLASIKTIQYAQCTVEGN